MQTCIIRIAQNNDKNVLSLFFLLKKSNYPMFIQSNLYFQQKRASMLSTFYQLMKIDEPKAKDYLKNTTKSLTEINRFMS